jgi:sulfur-carrier protein adenylyltransferase/sulfurtransferase
MNPRYARQVKLAEVGAGGQARIRESTILASGTGLSAVVCARYLAGAGFGRIVVESPEASRAARQIDPDLEVVVRVSGAVAPEGAGAGEASSSVEDDLEALEPVARDVARGAYRALVAFRLAVFRT